MPRPKKPDADRRESLSVTLPQSIKRFALATGNASEFFEFLARQAIKEIANNPDSFASYVRRIHAENALAAMEEEEDVLVKVARATIK